MASITKIPSGAYRVQTRRKGRCGRETFRRRDDAHRWTRQAETRGALPIAGCQRSRTPATLCEITRPNHEYTYRMITRNHLESYANCHYPSSTPKIAPREETQLKARFEILSLLTFRRAEMESDLQDCRKHISFGHFIGEHQ